MGQGGAAGARAGVPKAHVVNSQPAGRSADGRATADADPVLSSALDTVWAAERRVWAAALRYADDHAATFDELR